MHINYTKTLLRAHIPLVIQGNSNCTGLNLISITTSLNKRISLVQREETSKTNAKYQKDNRSQTLERYRRYKDHRVRTRA